MHEAMRQERISAASRRHLARIRAEGAELTHGASTWQASAQYSNALAAARVDAARLGRELDAARDGQAEAEALLSRLGSASGENGPRSAEIDVELVAHVKKLTVQKEELARQLAAVQKHQEDTGALRAENERLYKSQSAEVRRLQLKPGVWELWKAERLDAWQVRSASSLELQLREMSKASAQLEVERSQYKRRATNAEEQLATMQARA